MEKNQIRGEGKKIRLPFRQEESCEEGGKKGKNMERALYCRNQGPS